MRNLTTKVRGCVLGAVLALMSMASFADGTCNTGPVQCCNQVQTSSVTNLASLGSMLGLVLPNVGGLIGLNCTSIPAGSGASCSAQPVCCTINTFSGAVALGCTPVNINP